jgi:hypothetical protein
VGGADLTVVACDRRDILCVEQLAFYVLPGDETVVTRSLSLRQSA